MSRLTLGILAGGEGRRVGGRDKALLRRSGITQLETLLAWARSENLPILLSSQRGPAAYQHFGLTPIADDPLHRGHGPLAGLIAMMRSASTETLLSVPVDVRAMPADWHQRLTASLTDEYDVACVRDQEGVQPLIALWRLPQCLHALQQASAQGRWSVQESLRTLRCRVVGFDNWLFGNLNHSEDYDP